MGLGQDRPPAVGRGDVWLPVADLGAKAVLLLAVVQIGLDPAWGNLEGKAPGTRALTYPLIALVVPVVFALRATPGRYPWGADLLMTLPAFSDLLGNRLDLYDRLAWFDDLMHLANTGFLAAAVLVLSGVSHALVRQRLERAVAAGMTLAVAWELWEYVAFVTNSGEAVTAYGDTVGDLVLGWAGAVLAALLVSHSRGDGVDHGYDETPLGRRDVTAHR